MSEHPCPIDSRPESLTKSLIAEAEALLALLPAALDVQYTRSPTAQGERNDTGRRASGAHADPTADLALEPRRMHLSTVLTRSEAHLSDAVIRVRGVRRALERALRYWEAQTDEATT